MFKRLGWMVAATVLAVSAGMMIPRAGQADAPKEGCAGDPKRSDLAAGEGTIAITQREVVVIGSKRDGCVYQRPATDSGLIKHVAVEPGVGTAYVDDEADEDQLVIVTEDGVERIAVEGEATHPSWSEDGALTWAVDLRSLRVLAPGSHEVTTVPAPSKATGVFSPVFSSERTVTAVAQEAAGGFDSLSEDDVLNNLWRYDEITNEWTRLTHFEVTGDEWSAIRTPVVTEDGSVLFVRVHGNYTATGAPKFELWMQSGRTTQKLRDLPGEMYLAGMRNGRLMWNVYSNTCGDWELLVEDPARGLAHLGCGAVMVDPVNLSDQDLLVEEHGVAPAGPQGGGDVAVGVVVGDFETAEAAEAVAARIPGSEVLGHGAAPGAVRPGAFIVAVPGGADAEATLRMVKRKVPKLQDMVFLAPLGKLGG